MAWAVPRYSKGRVDAAAAAYLERDSSSDTFSSCGSPNDDMWERIGRLRKAHLLDRENLAVINNWRSSHSLPLYEIRKTLERRAKAVNQDAVLAQRIKRLPSIEKKLSDNAYRHLRLTQIEDIGGCRAILPTLIDAQVLYGMYRHHDIKSELFRERDYIREPKADGYRSVHLVYKYRSSAVQRQPFLGHRVEIQIRSSLQHAWATAVEVFVTFTGIPAKLVPGEVAAILPRPAEVIARWRRFFVLVSNFIALKEGSEFVPGAPVDPVEAREELRSLSVDLDAWRLFWFWRNRVSDLETITSIGASQFLLRLNPVDGSLRVTPYRKDQSEEAFEAYITAEQPTSDAPTANVALVSVDSVEDLRRAYPNYYGDTQVFLDVLKEAMS